MSWLSQGLALPGSAVPEDRAFVAFEVVATTSGPRLIAVTSPAALGGAVSLALTPGALPTVADHNDLTGIGPRLFHSGVSEADLNGTRILFVSGQGGAGVGGFTIDAAGNLVAPISFTATDGLMSTAPLASHIVTLEGRTFAYVADGQGLRAYEVGADRVFRPVEAEADSPTRYLSGVGEIRTVAAHGQTFALALAGTESGITAFRIDPATGALSETGRMGWEEGLGIAGPAEMRFATIGGQTFAVVASTNSSSLTVLRLGPDGALTVTDHLLDSLDTRFAHLTAVDVVTHGDRAFVVAGGGDDGVTLFALMPDGTLVHLQTIVDTAGLTLDNVAALSAVVVGDEIQIIVSSNTERGLSVFSLPLASLGQPILGTGAPETLTGGAGDDLIQGGSGSEALRGHAGRDILKDGGGQDAMWGGTGADLFVLSRDGAADTIMDFEPGVDRLDLSAWPMLYNLGQVGFTQTPTGALLTFGDEILAIHSAAGNPLELWQIFPGGLPGPYRPPLVLYDAAFQLAGTVRADTLNGGRASDFIDGRDGDDALDGLQGDDTILGGNGADLIFGGDGNDRIDGGAQADTIWGGAGDDTVTGGLGADRVYLGDGNDDFHDDAQTGVNGADWIAGDGGRDTIRGAGGNDTIFGNADEDVLYGGEGDDWLHGGDQSDTVDGGDGNDTLRGGNGRDHASMGAGDDLFEDEAQGGFWGSDWIDSGDGRDTVMGGGGHDTILGGAGDDLLYAGAGHDSVDGGADADLIHGGIGHDTIYGGDGADTVYAGEGDDWIDGGAQADVIHAGVGDDTVQGGLGPDRVFLNDGDDLFLDDPQRGRMGGDYVDGGAGNDTIHAGGGNDTLVGGAGADSFVFSRGSEFDVILDFQPGQDRVVFDVAGLTWEDLDITDTLDGAMVRYGEDSVLLANVEAWALSAADFNFL